MQWDQVRKTKTIMAAIKNNATFEGDKYSKLLIIVSGNLDEAYSMAESVEDADIDADVLHDCSQCTIG